MRLTIVNHNLGGGGAERNLTWLANQLTKDGKVVTIVTVDAADSFFELDPKVRRVPIGLAFPTKSALEAVVANLRRVRAIRRAVQESAPDLIIGFAFETNIQVLIASIGLGTPVLICEQTDPLLLKISQPWWVLRRLVYPSAAGVVCQTETILKRVSPLIRGRRFVIPNPVFPPTISAPAAPKSRQRLVTVGRMDPVKQFDLLLRVFSRLAPEHPDWELVLVGGGALLGSLQELSRELGSRIKSVSRGP